MTVKSSELAVSTSSAIGLSTDVKMGVSLQSASSGPNNAKSTVPVGAGLSSVGLTKKASSYAVSPIATPS